MKIKILLFFVLLSYFSCAPKKHAVNKPIAAYDFTITFGSCNKHNVENKLWDDVLALNPDVWIWGGDIVYADTDNMEKLKKIYSLQNEVERYRLLRNKVEVIGTWDDHDYGLNDGGVEFSAKQGSQQAFLDFMGVANTSPRRKREGVYTSHDFKDGKVKIIVLDTRYFRSALTPDNDSKKRFKPNSSDKGTVLGEEQWQWLESELKNSTASFNVLVSSIQFLSNEHGFECWGNFPNDVAKLESVITESKAEGVMILSGDRHISEFSKVKLDSVSYPLIDFTSSGLTHVYSSYSGEPNLYRVGEVVSKKSFGMLGFSLNKGVVEMKIIGDNGEILGELIQSY